MWIFELYGTLTTIKYEDYKPIAYCALYIAYQFSHTTYDSTEDFFEESNLKKEGVISIQRFQQIQREILKALKFDLVQSLPYDGIISLAGAEHTRNRRIKGEKLQITYKTDQEKISDQSRQLALVLSSLLLFVESQSRWSNSWSSLEIITLSKAYLSGNPEFVATVLNANRDLWKESLQQLKKIVSYVAQAINSYLRIFDISIDITDIIAEMSKLIS